MEFILKNISPEDYTLFTDLAIRLGIKVEQNDIAPDHSSVVDDLKEAIAEIKLAEAGKIKLQNARDLINEL